MEIQEQTVAEDENNAVEVEEIENTEKRLYNGFQGPLTETEENGLQPNISASSSDNIQELCPLLLIIIFLI